ncbi:MAG: hypothetical protein Q4G03_05630 [Planctomycetia bacterium]|nr:hypothetical protein [Planctomycetia bacterium]
MPRRKKDSEDKSEINSAQSRRASLNDESDELVFAVCERFFHYMAPKSPAEKYKRAKKDNETDQNSGKPKRQPGAAKAVAQWLNTERNRPDFNRESVYPLLWTAFQRGFLLLQPPLVKELRDQLVEKYQLTEKLAKDDGDLAIVNVVGKTTSRHVSSTAADLVIKLIDRVYARKVEEAKARGESSENVRVHLGFGAGYAAMEVAKRLSNRTEVQTPKLTLHALTPGGFHISEQYKDPTTYFAYLAEKGHDVECIGFFSPPVIMTEGYKQLRENPAMKHCFEQRDDIDVLVTSLAAASDPHGLYGKYFNYLYKNGYVEENVSETLKKQDWVGDVLFQPYSAKEAIQPETIRSVALFDFQELVDFAKKPGKYLVLIGGPCGECGELKTEAIEPLLTEDLDRPWTHLVIDCETASRLL